MTAAHWACIIPHRGKLASSQRAIRALLEPLQAKSSLQEIHIVVSATPLKPCERQNAFILPLHRQVVRLHALGELTHEHASVPSADRSSSSKTGSIVQSESSFNTHVFETIINTCATSKHVFFLNALVANLTTIWICPVHCQKVSAFLRKRPLHHERGDQALHP